MRYANGLKCLLLLGLIDARTVTIAKERYETVITTHMDDDRPSKEYYGESQRAERAAEAERARRERERKWQRYLEEQAALEKEQAIRQALFVKNAEITWEKYLYDALLIPFTLYAGTTPGEVLDNGAYDVAYKKMMEHRRACGGCDMTSVAMLMGAEYQTAHAVKPPRTDARNPNPIPPPITISVPRTVIPPPADLADARRRDREVVQQALAQQQEEQIRNMAAEGFATGLEGVNAPKTRMDEAYRQGVLVAIDVMGWCKYPCDPTEEVKKRAQDQRMLEILIGIRPRDPEPPAHVFKSGEPSKQPVEDDVRVRHN
jgi:hypothetical protein